MSQHATILAFLREGPKTLRQIAAHPAGIFYEWRSRVAELRKLGYGIRHHKPRNCKHCWKLGVNISDHPALADIRFEDDNCPAIPRGEAVYVLEADPSVSAR